MRRLYAPAMLAGALRAASRGGGPARAAVSAHATVPLTPVPTAGAPGVPPTHTNDTRRCP